MRVIELPPAEYSRALEKLARVSRTTMALPAEAIGRMGFIEHRDDETVFVVCATCQP